LRHTFVPRIRYLGFTTRGKKGPLTTTGDLSDCNSKRTLIQLLTVNSPRQIRAVAGRRASDLRYIGDLARGGHSSGQQPGGASGGGRSCGSTRGGAERLGSSFLLTAATCSMQTVQSSPELARPSPPRAATTTTLPGHARQPPPVPASPPAAEPVAPLCPSILALSGPSPCRPLAVRSLATPP
jgi:hypothetical protein